MRSYRKNIRIALLAIAFILACFAAGIKNISASWQGVDETVVERVAEEQGRQPWKPLINTDQGDLLLFVFLIAGAAGGFVMGFCWRKLFHE